MTLSRAAVCIRWTVWGVALYLVVVGTATLAGFSEFGQAFVKALA